MTLSVQVIRYTTQSSNSFFLKIRSSFPLCSLPVLSLIGCQKNFCAVAADSRSSHKCEKIGGNYQRVVGISSHSNVRF